MRAAATFALTLALAAVAETTSAAVFEVRVCGSTPHAVFTPSNPSPGTIETGIQCPSTTGTIRSGIFAVARPNTQTPDGSGATWTIAAPAGMTLRRLDLRRSLGTRREPWKIRVRTREELVIEACDLDGRIVCQLGEPAGDTSAAYTNLNTQSVSFAMECRTFPAASTCPGWATPQAWIAIYSAVALVDDPSPPVIDSLTGSVLAAGWHKGDRRLDVSASDLSGIRSVLISAGSTTLYQQEQPCDYTRMQPCPATKQTSLAVDTARLPDGPHELRVAVTDAAGQATVSTSTLRVDQTAPAAPAELYVERNPDRTVSMVWKNPDQGTAAPITGARYEVCSALGVACVGGPMTSGQGVSRIDSVVIPDGEHLVKVWLQDEAGNVDPANAATLTVDPSKLTSRTVGMNPPVLTDGPVPSSRMKITRARRSGSTLTISGTIARAANARIEAQVSRSKIGRPVVAKARVKPKRGKWTVRVKLPASLRNTRAMYLTVKYAGQNAYRATTLRRRLTERAPQAGRGSDEFSLEARSR